MTRPTPFAPQPEKACILCGRCLEVCPLFLATNREELSPRAKQQLAAAEAAGSLPLGPVKELAALCLSCGRCEAACPQGLCAPELVARLRQGHPGLQEWLWRTWLQRGAVLWPALATLGRLAPASLAGSHTALRLRFLRALGPTVGAPLQLHPLPSHSCTTAPTLLFPGCLATTVRRDWTATAGQLLGLTGASVLPQPEWACCGCTLGHAGLQTAQRQARERNIALWRAGGRPRLVVYCNSCLCGLRAYARDPSLPWEPGEAQRWQQAVTPLSAALEGLEFEVEQSGPGRVLYHRPCHGGGRGGAKNPDQRFLERVLGPRLLPAREPRCCGMGGILQLGAPELCRKVATACWQGLGAAAGDLVLTGCSGCVLQLAATAPQGTLARHWLDCVAPPQADRT